MSEQASKSPLRPELREAVVHGSAEGFRQEVTVAGHRLVVDERRSSSRHSCSVRARPR
jgi:hypothetical protein